VRVYFEPRLCFCKEIGRDIIEQQIENHVMKQVKYWLWVGILVSILFIVGCQKQAEDFVNKGKISSAIVQLIEKRDESEIVNDFFNVDADLQPSGELKEVQTGTAFFISEDGLLITCKHLVNNLDSQYFVRLKNGEEKKVKVLSRDSKNDIAILKLENMGQAVSFLNFSDSNQLSVGDHVFAMGNYEYMGEIIALNQSVEANDALNLKATFTNLIQTNLDIDPGDSGSPLLNEKGELIGMNVAFDTEYQGTAFAIPSEDLQYFIAESP